MSHSVMQRGIEGEQRIHASFFCVGNNINPVKHYLVLLETPQMEDLTLQIIHPGPP